MTPWQWALGVVVGFLAGVLSGLFGVGGGILTTPAVNVLLGGIVIVPAFTVLVGMPLKLAAAYGVSELAGLLGGRG